MKVLSILQPWASLVVAKDPKTGKAYKQIETRSWNTKYRGPLLIHASKAWKSEQELFLNNDFLSLALQNKDCRNNLTRGAIIGMVNMVDTFSMETAGKVFQKMSDIGIKDQDQELAFGDYSHGRYGWLLSDPILFKTPIPCKGNLSIWNLPGELEDQVQEQISIASGRLNFEPTLIATPGEGAVIVEGFASSTDYANIPNPPEIQLEPYKPEINYKCKSCGWLSSFDTECEVCGGSLINEAPLPESKLHLPSRVGRWAR